MFRMLYLFHPALIPSLNTPIIYCSSRYPAAAAALMGDCGPLSPLLGQRHGIAVQLIDNATDSVSKIVFNVLRNGLFNNAAYIA